MGLYRKIENPQLRIFGNISRKRTNYSHFSARFPHTYNIIIFRRRKRIYVWDSGGPPPANIYIIRTWGGRRGASHSYIYKYRPPPLYIIVYRNANAPIKRIYNIRSVAAFPYYYTIPGYERRPQTFIYYTIRTRSHIIILYSIVVANGNVYRIIKYDEWELFAIIMIIWTWCFCHEM